VWFAFVCECVVAVAVPRAVVVAVQVQTAEQRPLAHGRLFMELVEQGLVWAV
jgi:hypothetical protein